ncbi:hypothetical protein NEMBOFW57_009815 [Staphylotrichum longicolle]|uniref:Uncharacterized protein n=1 Tax=Staphylotrichum longicolle TaxID=669026 RepID=A0AAD4EPS4_9PEZI|nr:hypothetical protein NEMBOFW57_009815 [Staphylotrichum longicolle]
MHYRTDRAREHGFAAPRLGGKSFKPPAKVAEGEFDPDELTRRLYVVLAEQKARARKQRARGEARGEASSKRDGQDRSSGARPRDGAKPGREGRHIPTEPPADLITELRRCESGKEKTSKTSQTAVSVSAPDAPASDAAHYHHVPNQAAKQFTRTTTVENMRGNNDHVHKLSKRALQFHMEGPRAARPGGGEAVVAPAELSRALQQTQTQRDRLSERNQFQRTRILEDAARLDRDQLSPRKHTFGDELSRILPDSHAHPSTTTRHARRNSTGNATDLAPQASDSALARRSLIAPDASLLATLDPLLEDILTPPHEELGRFPPADRARVDWSQSDESKSRPKLLLFSPLLRKADSLWALRGRRGSKDSSGSAGAAATAGSGENGDEAAVAAAQSPTTPTAKTGKGFFGRFKR